MLKLKLIDEAKTMIARLNEANPSYVAGGLIFVILALDFLLVMQFQIRELSSVGSGNRELVQTLAKNKTDVENTPTYQKQIESLKNQLAQTNKNIQSREGLPLALEEISRAAIQYQVSIEKIMPDPAEEKSILKTSDGEYFLIPVTVEAKSGYHAFGHFLNHLERENPFLKIAEFQISGVPEGTPKHDIDLILHAIFFDTMGHAE